MKGGNDILKKLFRFPLAVMQNSVGQPKFWPKYTDQG